jgi:hypothetical protein
MPRGGKRPGAGRKPVLDEHQRLLLFGAVTRLERDELTHLNVGRTEQVKQWRTDVSDYDDFIRDLHSIPVELRSRGQAHDMYSEGYSEDNLTEPVRELLNLIREEKRVLQAATGFPRAPPRTKSGRREEHYRTVAREASEWGLKITARLVREVVEDIARNLERARRDPYIPRDV